jgi:hypothetical protein
MWLSVSLIVDRTNYLFVSVFKVGRRAGKAAAFALDVNLASLVFWRHLDGPLLTFALPHTDRGPRQGRHRVGHVISTCKG